jgi:hypothetical protein
VTEIQYVRRGTPDYSLATYRTTNDVTLYEMATNILQRTVQAFAERGVELPSRQMVYIAPLPVDCEQLSVLISGWVPDPPPVELTACQAFRWCGNFDIVVSRVSPAIPRGSKAPTVDQMNEASRIAAEDAECVLAVVRGLGEIGPEFSFVVGAPQGGFQTVVCSVQIPAAGGLD